MSFRILTAVGILASATLASACANSVLNDPAEMERRRAYVERQQAAHERFWGRVIGPETSTSTGRQGGSSTLYQQGANTPSQCRAIGGTWNYGSSFCWRI